MSPVKAARRPAQVLITLLALSIMTERIYLSLHILGFVPLICPCLPTVTFARTGPSFKRGPPKGYIHAIEQRWHQVESVLGAILSSTDPYVQALINNLRKDDLARDILSRVDSGPFVSTSKSPPF
jgi:hypothetical protein